MLPDIQPGNTKILYFFNCLLDGMHTIFGVFGAEMSQSCDISTFCIGNEPKSGLARDLDDCLQSRNVLFGTSGDFPIFSGDARKM